MTTERPRATGQLTTVALAIVVGAACLMVAIVGIRALNGPSFVDVLVVNPTVYRVHVEVTSGDRSGWLGLGHVGPERTDRVQDTIDQGDQWIFRFAASEKDFEVRVGKEQLARDGWHVKVPAELAAHLRSTGVPPSDG